MAAPIIDVITRDNDPTNLFGRLYDNEDVKEYHNLCKRAADYRMEPERVGYLEADTSHILRLMVGDQMVGFAYVNANPLINVGDKYLPTPYAELILICGPKYTFNGKKGSTILIEKGIEIAKTAGKTSLRLEALNKELYTEVYAPLGFKPVKGKYLEYELPFKKDVFSKIKSFFTRKNGGRRHRTRKTKVRGKK